MSDELGDKERDFLSRGVEDLPPSEGKFASTVRVGAKGQIVIPKEARELFDINPGDTLLLLADSNQGIAIMRRDLFDQFIDAAMPSGSATAEAERETGQRESEERETGEGEGQS